MLALDPLSRPNCFEILSDSWLCDSNNEEFLFELDCKKCEENINTLSLSQYEFTKLKENISPKVPTKNYTARCTIDCNNNKLCNFIYDKSVNTSSEANNSNKSMDPPFRYPIKKSADEANEKIDSIGERYKKTTDMENIKKKNYSRHIKLNFEEIKKEKEFNVKIDKLLQEKIDFSGEKENKFRTKANKTFSTFNLNSPDRNEKLPIINNSKNGTPQSIKSSNKSITSNNSNKMFSSPKKINENNQSEYKKSLFNSVKS
jgi:hypothetical protein